MSDQQTAPTPNPAPAPTPNPAPVDNGMTPFYSGFKDEATKGYAHQKQFQDPESAVHAYMNLEKLMGVPQDRIIKMPEAADSPEMEAVWNKLGKPAKPEEYKLAIPEQATEQDKKFYDFAKNAFHKANLTASQAEAVIKQINEFSLNTFKESQEAHDQAIKAQNIALEKEWGAAHTQNTNIASAAAKAFGVSHEQIDKIQSALGYADTMKLFQRIGDKMGEARFVSGDQTNNQTYTPDMAKAEIETLKNDASFMAKYVAGDHQAKAKMQKLFESAFPN
jgi:hypothetical protein